MALRLSAAGFADLVRSPTARSELGPLRDRSVIVVEHPPGAPTPVPSTLTRSLPAVVVGIGPPHDGVDVAVDDETAAATVVAAVERNPIAAVTLVQLLRLNETTDAAHALVAESLAYATLQGGPEFARWLAGRGTRVRSGETEPPVVIDRDGDTLRVVLNRPRLHNLYNAAMRDALVDALVLATVDPSVIVELSGTGKSFCAGGDLAEFGAVSDPATAHIIRSTANAAPYLHAIADRIRVSVHGASVGAGVELAAFAGHIRAQPGAWFQLPEVGMGLVPGAGGTVSIPGRIGRHRSAWMALTGERIDAPTALAWGLIDAIA